MSEYVSTPHINPKPGSHIAKVVLMPGDPLRAKYIAEHYLDNPILFNDVRNMLGYTGTYEGHEVSVMGSGMGVPSLSIYAYELYNIFGVEAIFRVGSAGGLSESVHLRDVLIAMTASTNSSVPGEYDFPGTLAPTADYDLLAKAVAAAKEIGVSTSVGSVYTSDLFYHPDPDFNKKIRDMGMLAIEMETAGLYALAMASGKKALSILTVSDHLFTGESLSAIERQDSFHEMMEVALKTAIRV